MSSKPKERCAPSRLGARGPPAACWSRPGPKRVRRPSTASKTFAWYSRTSSLRKEKRLLELLREYRRGWNEDAVVRASRRATVEARLPPRDWLWKAAERSQHWVRAASLMRHGGRALGPSGHRNEQIRTLARPQRPAEARDTAGTMADAHRTPIDLLELDYVFSPAYLPAPPRGRRRPAEIGSEPGDEKVDRTPSGWSPRPAPDYTSSRPSRAVRGLQR